MYSVYTKAPSPALSDHPSNPAYSVRFQSKLCFVPFSFFSSRSKEVLCTPQFSSFGITRRYLSSVSMLDSCLCKFPYRQPHFFPTLHAFLLCFDLLDPRKRPRSLTPLLFFFFFCISSDEADGLSPRPGFARVHGEGLAFPLFLPRPRAPALQMRTLLPPFLIFPPFPIFGGRETS